MHVPAEMAAKGWPSRINGDDRFNVNMQCGCFSRCHLVNELNEVVNEFSFLRTPFLSQGVGAPASASLLTRWFASKVGAELMKGMMASRFVLHSPAHPSNL
jgi:hypothetical protein